VQDNVQLALPVRASLPEKAAAHNGSPKGLEAARIGTSGQSSSKPQLSGGQQQRVAIARAGGGTPRPAASRRRTPPAISTALHGQEVMRLLRELNEEGMTLVMVTHSAEHAALPASRRRAAP